MGGRRDGGKARARGTLFGRYVVVMTAVALVCFAAFSAWSFHEQARQVEEQMVAEARVFEKSVRATWDFMDNVQDRINYDSQGNYEFKGLYCSLVGKSVGKLFSVSTDNQYQLRYTRFDPRNVLDAPDEFEAEALALFAAGDQVEYYGVVENAEGAREFRFVSAIPLKESCLECHGGPVGELDITGYPKEGLAVGDLAGAVSITMPMAMHEEALAANVVRTGLFLVVLLTAILGASMLMLRRHVGRPLVAIGDSLADVASGKMDQVDLAGVGTTRETDALARGVEDMARELGELYATLESKVDERTHLYREANDELERQKERIAEANALLEAANAKLSEENEYRTNIISIISHELRTPLTAILSFVDLWETSGEVHSPQDEQYIGKVRTHSRTLLEMVNNVLDIARLEAGRIEIARDPIDPVDLAGSVVDLYGGLARTQGVALTSQIDPAAPLFLGDWDQLHKILGNLVGNALKFTPEGGSVLVRVGVGDVPNVLVLHVVDTGIGIEADRIDGIFDRFVQADASISRKYRGSGLGLSLVKKTAEALGGRVGVVSAPGEGSTFTVELPVEPVAMEDDGEEFGR